MLKVSMTKQNRQTQQPQPKSPKFGAQITPAARQALIKGIAAYKETLPDNLSHAQTRNIFAFVRDLINIIKQLPKTTIEYSNHNQYSIITLRGQHLNLIPKEIQMLTIPKGTPVTDAVAKLNGNINTITNFLATRGIVNEETQNIPWMLTFDKINTKEAAQKYLSSIEERLLIDRFMQSEIRQMPPVQNKIVNSQYFKDPFALRRVIPQQA